MMTVPDVEREVDLIRDVSHDFEAAHSREDALWAGVLEAIASGTCADPAGCARAAPRAKDIDFPRHCA